MTRDGVMTQINMLRKIPDPSKHTGKVRDRLTEMRTVHFDILRKWYAQEVGYDPMKDHPAMTPKELAELCASYVEEMDHFGAWSVSDQARSTGRP